MKWISSLIVLVSMNLAWAQEKPVEPPQEASVEEEKPRTAGENAPQFMAVAQVVGIGPISGSSTGLSLGIFVTPRSILSIDYLNIRYSSLYFSFLDKYEISGDSIGLGYKYFVGRSFYTKATANYRYTSYKREDDWLSDDYQTRFKAVTYEVGFAIGNQWQIGNFTLGCDWFGFAQPLSSKISNEYFSDGATNYDLNRHEDDQKTLTKNINFKAVQFYLGATF
ncbi:MAG: hypothetical protein AB7H97_09680 [Pseudobdellovibrionaceae bacterium]